MLSTWSVSKVQLPLFGFGPSLAQTEFMVVPTSGEVLGMFRTGFGSGGMFLTGSGSEGKSSYDKIKSLERKKNPDLSWYCCECCAKKWQKWRLEWVKPSEKLMVEHKFGTTISFPEDLENNS